MKITLQDVRNVLRSAFGRESFVASFIKSVESDTSIQTACINVHGEMRYNPQFVNEYIKGRSDLFCLITHELLHPMFGHFVYNTRNELESIGADMVINATISVVFSDESDSGGLFRKFYPENGMLGLLRPQSRMNQSRYSGLYHSFYGTSNTKLSTGEAIQSLKILTPSQDIGHVPLLGSHDVSQDKAHGAFSQDVLSRIAVDLQNMVKARAKRCAGWNIKLYDLITEVLKTHIGLKKALLQRYLTQKKVDRFLSTHFHPGIATSPIPLRPSKRDLVLLSAGIYPLHYHQQISKPVQKENGLAVYLDVSGSVNEYLPKIIGLLQGFQKSLLTIYLFSNKVVEVPFSSLLNGYVQTTYGTDFDCIATSILEKGLDKAVVMTDGYANLEEKNQEDLKQHDVRLLTILFGEKQECPEFSPFGDVMRLADVVE